MDEVAAVEVLNGFEHLLDDPLSSTFRVVMRTLVACLLKPFGHSLDDHNVFAIEFVGFFHGDNAFV